MGGEVGGWVGRGEVGRKVGARWVQAARWAHGGRDASALPPPPPPAAPPALAPPVKDMTATVAFCPAPSLSKPTSSTVAVDSSGVGCAASSRVVDQAVGNNSGGQAFEPDWEEPDWDD